MERLQKVIANSGYTSRRKAEELIVNKEVFVARDTTTNTAIDNISYGNLRIKKIDKENYSVYIFQFVSCP